MQVPSRFTWVVLALTLRLAAADVEILGGGFRARQIAVELANLNHLEFAPDGRLFALGYDGRVHVLRDRDGDGIEDTAQVFWDRPTLQVPVGMAWAPEGVYIASHGKISLLRDDDLDGRADREEIVAADWVPPDNPSGGVDAIGLALDAEGNLYFGLGCADYSNAYRLRDGKASYDLQSVRGTIQKLSPDRQRRETVCTGVRFTYDLAFNEHGDLFATDQEGETWLPGGNPLDEINHIVQGRHYGFPPRHDQHLPDVFDEPPVVGIGPQHQSTCGLAFNLGGRGRKLFGPESWRGNAFVAGFSRGKIWRVELVKGLHGYVGRSSLFAATAMLVADVTISPRGELYFCCHSGPPDWGSGPSGKGKIFRIESLDAPGPRPQLAWVASPLEVRVALDRPLAVVALAGLEGLAVTYGEAVRTGDRFEVLRPGYAAVKTQEAAPRGKLRLAGATLLDEGMTLRLATDPHTVATTHALEIAALGINLDYDLSGVAASWLGADGASWSGWLPSLDLEVSRALLPPVQRRELDRVLRRAGTLTLSTRLDLSQRLYGAADEVSVQARAAGAVVMELAGVKASGGPACEISTRWRGEPLPLRLELRTATDGVPASLDVALRTSRDGRWLPLPLALQVLPWAPRRALIATTPPPVPPELAGGDARRGEAVFFGDKARCSLCHVRGGKGGSMGPDLSNLVHRDAASVYRDIAEPSATIHPDYTSHAIVRRDGSVVVGVLRAHGVEQVRLSDANAQEFLVRRDEVQSLEPQAVSIMPASLPETLGREAIKDLLAYLLADPGGRPPLRTRQEVETALGPVAAAPQPLVTPLRVLLVSGPQDHGPGEHDYPAWQKRWAEWLSSAPGVRVATASDWPSSPQWSEAQVVVFYFWNHDWSPARYADLDAFLARGGGAVFLHSATIADKDPEALAERIGLAAQPVRTRYRHGPVEIRLPAPAGAEVALAIKGFHLVDEPYWPMIGDASRVTVLATAMEEGREHPMMWTFENGKGRVFASIPGHYAWTLDDPLFRALILRGLAWAAREPVRRLDALATRGVSWR